MKNIFKTASARTQKFLVDHKVAIAVTATAATCLWLNKVALREHEAFMAEHGILEAFYTVSDDE